MTPAARADRNRPDDRRGRTDRRAVAVENVDFLSARPTLDARARLPTTRCFPQFRSIVLRSLLHALFYRSIRMRIPLCIVAALLAMVVGCGRNDEADTPRAATPIDSAARAFLHVLASRDMDAVRKPLSQRGKDSLTVERLAPIFDYFASGPPNSATLISSEVATSDSPVPAQRHRLIYRLQFPDERTYYYHFEMTIADNDTAITGFQIEPAQ